MEGYEKLMNHQSYLIKKIEQKDNQSFSIEWGDGVTKDYYLNDLQNRCPCANCVDEKTGNQIEAKVIKKDVSAVSISSVGRYALRIQFLTGCSHGIFGFDMLRHLEDYKKDI